MKRFLMVSLLCAFAFTAAACGNNGNGKGKKNRCGRCPRCVSQVVEAPSVNDFPA